MKIKALLTASAVALTAAAAHAETDFSGAYVGLNAGYGIGKFDIKDDGYVNDMSIDGLDGGLHLGYQKDFGKFVAGLELHGNFSGANTRFKDSEEDFKISRGHSFGASAKLGMKLNSWLAYVRAGYDRAKYELKDNGIKERSNANGFLGGLGVETMLTSNIMFGGEYNHIRYQKFKNSHTKPSYNTFKLRLSYKF